MKHLLFIAVFAIGMTAAAQTERHELFNMIGTVIEKKKIDDYTRYTLEIRPNMAQFVRDNVDMWVMVNQGEIMRAWQRNDQGLETMAAKVGGWYYYMGYSKNIFVVNIRRY